MKKDYIYKCTNLNGRNFEFYGVFKYIYPDGKDILYEFTFLYHNGYNPTWTKEHFRWPSENIEEFEEIGHVNDFPEYLL